MNRYGSHTIGDRSTVFADWVPVVRGMTKNGVYGTPTITTTSQGTHRRAWRRSGGSSTGRNREDDDVPYRACADRRHGLFG